MKKIQSTALVALFAALGVQAVFAQGQSSGEDTRKRNQQQQSQSQQPYSSSQSSSTSQYRSSQPGQSSQSSQSQTQTTPSPSGQSAQTSSSTQSSPSTQSSQSTTSSDAFKSDTSTSGSISAQGSSSQPSSSLTPTPSTSSQGSPAAGQTSTSASGRPGQTQTSANVQVNQQNVTQFQSVFSNWRPGANQEAQLTAAINAAAPGGRINHEFVTRVATDLNTVLPRAHLSVTAQQRLATAFATVLTPTVEVTTLEPALTEVRQILVESGLAPIQAQTVACDLHLMAAQVHPELLEIQVK